MRQLCPNHHRNSTNHHRNSNRPFVSICHSHQLPKLHQPVPILQLQHRLQSQHGHKFPSQMEYLKKPFEQVRRWQIMPKILCLASSARKSLLALEKDYRLSLVKDATFNKYCIEDKHKSWSLCRKAIDSAIRKLRFKNIYFVQ